MIVVNGESGSGKTETSKHAIDFIAKVSSKNDAIRKKIEIVSLFIYYLCYLIDLKSKLKINFTLFLLYLKILSLNYLFS